MIVLPFFDNNLEPKKLSSFVTLDEHGVSTAYNVLFNKSTPFYRLPKLSQDEFKQEFIESGEHSFFKTKELYKLFGYNSVIKDVNNILWSHDLDVNYFGLEDDKIKNIPFYVREFSNLFFEDYFDLICSDKKQNKNIHTLIKASSIIDGYIYLGDEKLYKYFDHYTKGGRFHDILSNSINIEAQNRGKIRAKGVKVYVDIDSFHLRLLDRYLGINMIPYEQRGHNWIIEQAFGNTPPKDIKKRVFQALYSENFNLVPCDFMDFVKLRYKKLKSPLGRKNRSFNDKVQEHDVLEISKIINGCYDHGFDDILLYLYDGLLFDINVKKLDEFLQLLQEIITFPFTVNINDEILRF